MSQTRGSFSLKSIRAVPYRSLVHVVAHSSRQLTTCPRRLGRVCASDAITWILAIAAGRLLSGLFAATLPAIHLSTRTYLSSRKMVPHILNFLGSRTSISALFASPSNSISAMRHPVAGPFCMPQHVCPAAIQRPDTDVWPIRGPRSLPNLMCCGR